MINIKKGGSINTLPPFFRCFSSFIRVKWNTDNLRTERIRGYVSDIGGR